MVVVVVIIAKKVKKLLVPYMIVYCYLTYFIYDVSRNCSLAVFAVLTLTPYLRSSKAAKTAVDIISVDGGAQQSFHYGEAPPRSPTVSNPLPFPILFLTEKLPFHVSSLECCSVPFTCRLRTSSLSLFFLGPSSKTPETRK